MKIDVLCVGLSAFDLVYSVSRHPEPDEKMSAYGLVACGGGPAANAAVTVARLGLKCAYAGYLGPDTFGEKHFQEFKSEGVITDFIVRGREPTPLACILVKPNGHRTVVAYPVTHQTVPAGSVDFSKVQPTVILLDGHELELARPLVARARSEGIRTVLDAGSVHPGTEYLIDKVDYLVCSEEFALDFTGESEARSALSKLYESNSTVVITLGDRGLIWKNESGEGHLPAFNADVVDTTGAGDAFHGAFAACVAWGRDWEYTLRYSSAVAALCCTKLGARIGIPTKEQVEDFLAER
jgi:sulfofructose kinase